jgi:hypothetical protein
VPQVRKCLPRRQEGSTSGCSIPAPSLPGPPFPALGTRGCLTPCAVAPPSRCRAVVAVRMACHGAANSDAANRGTLRLPGPKDFPGSVRHFRSKCQHDGSDSAAGRTSRHHLRPNFKLNQRPIPGPPGPGSHPGTAKERATATHSESLSHWGIENPSPRHWHLTTCSWPGLPSRSSESKPSSRVKGVNRQDDVATQRYA